MADSFPGKVLIIDDDQDVLNIYSRTLSKAGYITETALGGSEGYAKILQGGYDLVLLDMVMPDLDGISILKRLNQRKQETREKQSPDESLYNGPIIILSQMDQPQLIESAYSLGAKGYLIKASISNEQLADKIFEILSKK